MDISALPKLIFAITGNMPICHILPFWHYLNINSVHSLDFSIAKIARDKLKAKCTAG
jgi:hypothetical protein